MLAHKLLYNKVFFFYKCYNFGKIKLLCGTKIAQLSLFCVIILKLWANGI